MELLIPLSPFITILGITWIICWYSALTRRLTHETIRTAIESGQQLTPESIKALGAPTTSSNWDITTGAILLAIAVAFIVLGIALFLARSDDWTIISLMTGVAAFPGFVGAVLFWLGQKRKNQRD